MSGSTKKGIGFWRWILRIAAVGYPLSLLAIVLGFRFIGERWWVTVAALYLPRLPFAAPLPFLVAALAFAGPRRLLVGQLAALLILIPLLGFKLSLPRRPTAGAAHVRVLSFNVNSRSSPVDELVAEIRSTGADITLFQEVPQNGATLLAALLPDYHVHGSGQFFLASRYPILEAFEPPKIPFHGVLRSPRFMRYRLQGPRGPIQVYNVHPPSPREGLDELYGDGIRAEVENGRILDNVRAMTLIASVAELRTTQMCKVAADAGVSADPVIIAGDTNLPGLSWAFSHCYGQFEDGFATVGNGLGYSFPSTRRMRPWMRIDRVLTNDRFRFLDFAVAPAMSSDHRSVIADLELGGSP